MVEIKNRIETAEVKRLRSDQLRLTFRFIFSGLIQDLIVSSIPDKPISQKNQR